MAGTDSGLTTFSADSAEYAKYRPNYPDKMIRDLVDQCPGNGLAIDCATGNGQVVAQLSPHFDEVIGIDREADQIEHAVQRENIEYRVESAEELNGIPDNSADLITVATAIHWFVDQPKFFANARRVLKTNGILSIFAITGPQVQKDPNALTDFGEKYFDKYVPKNFKPTSEIETPDGFALVDMPPVYTKADKKTVDDLCGYIRTVSAWTALMEEGVGENILDELRERLSRISEDNLDVSYDAHIRVFRKV